MRCGFLGVCVNPMRNFQSVDVSVVFKHAAHSGADWLREEAENAEDEENHGQGCPITQFANVPALAPSAEEPSGETVEQVKSNEDNNRDSAETNHYVVQNVVPHFVTE